MSIENSINNEIKQAMLAKEKEKLEALRAVKAAILLEKTKKGGTHEETADEVVMGLLHKLIKQRRESAAIYLAQNRKDLAETEIFQASVIERYLPAQMSEETLIGEIKKIIADTGASSIREMGKVMGLAAKKLAGQADNKTVAELVKKLLS